MVMYPSSRQISCSILPPFHSDAFPLSTVASLACQSHLSFLLGPIVLHFNATQSCLLSHKPIVSTDHCGAPTLQLSAQFRSVLHPIGDASPCRTHLFFTGTRSTFPRYFTLHILLTTILGFHITYSLISLSKNTMAPIISTSRHGDASLLLPVQLSAAS